VQFCSNNESLDNFFQTVLDGIQHALVILMVITLLAAVLATVPYLFLEWWSWRKLKRHAQLAESSLQSMEKVDFIEILQIVANPISHRFSALITDRIHSPDKKIRIRWFVAYVTHAPALLVLAISVAAYLSCLFQLALLHEVQKSTPVLVTDIANFRNEVSGKLRNATAVWVSGTNGQISEAEQLINQNMFGWAQESTRSLNNTLNTCKYYLESSNMY